MRPAVDYAQRVEECRRLAKLAPKPEDWGHLLEMAATWEMLLTLQQERARQQTIALADRFRNVLSLSDSQTPAEEAKNEKVA